MEEQTPQSNKKDNDLQRERKLAARKLEDLLIRSRKLHPKKNQQNPENSKENVTDNLTLDQKKELIARKMARILEWARKVNPKKP
jgi:hypothetical protein